MIKLPTGREREEITLGTWGMGEQKDSYHKEVAAVTHAIERGIRQIDTAEMYGEGGAESVVGEAIAPFAREELYIVSKVYPHNANAAKIQHSIDQTLRRLGTDYLDLYLLHWITAEVDFEEVIGLMEGLVSDGRIRAWGVSNFDTKDMKRLLSLSGGHGCQTNQVLYHLGSRGIEYDLKPYLDETGIPIMAYCPLAQGLRLSPALAGSEIIGAVCDKYGINKPQLLLRFVLNQSNIMPIIKSSNPAHIDELLAARSLEIATEDWNHIEKAFPAPSIKEPLDVV